MNPIATPRRSPTKIRPDAYGSTTFHTTWRGVPRKARHISTSDGDVLRMPLYEFMAITGTASTVTARTLAVRPIPYTKVISGMIAAIGAAWAMTASGSTSHSIDRLRPMATPAATPTAAEMATPITSGWSVDA